MPRDLTAISLADRFRRAFVAEPPEEMALRAIIKPYATAIQAVLCLMLERHERDPGYGFLDTKIDVLAGTDFPADDTLRGRETVYAWIQGRGLEALAGHARWLATARDIPTDARDQLVGRTRSVAAAVLERMEALRRDAGGRLSFMMSRDGRPLTLDEHGRLKTRELLPQSPANFSDLFYSKGLAAAGALLGRDEAVREGQRIFDRVIADIRSARFESDQEALDPRNPVRPVPGRIPQGPMMIAIGSACVFVEITGDAAYRDLGFELIDRILNQYVSKKNGSFTAAMRRFDLWEFNDIEGCPVFENGALRCDPGHATEFVGLSLKFLRTCESRGLMDGAHARRAVELRETLLGVLEQNFANGFAATGIGMCKAFDLAARQPMNTDMPWWSLPETMRAALEAWAVAPPSVKPVFAGIAARCSNAFMRYYIRTDRWLMANQTLDLAGNPVDRIPATPDADPGYHTGLSLIDCLQRLEDACSSGGKK